MKKVRTAIGVSATHEKSADCDRSSTTHEKSVN